MYTGVMNEQELHEQFENDIQAFALKYSLTRLKVSTYNFDRDYKLGDDGTLHLVQTKAVIRVLGKTTKVPIGDTEQYKTYEEAFEVTKKYWSEYYKNIRAKRSPEQLKAEALRQKRYRERRKEKLTKLKRQQ